MKITVARQIKAIQAEVDCITESFTHHSGRYKGKIHQMGRANPLIIDGAHYLSNLLNKDAR